MFFLEILQYIWRFGGVCRKNGLIHALLLAFFSKRCIFGVFKFCRKEIFQKYTQFFAVFAVYGGAVGKNHSADSLVGLAHFFPLQIFHVSVQLNQGFGFLVYLLG